MQNWMTDLNLICAEPYKIGAIGTIGFIGLTAGSALFMNVSDKYGRRKTILLAGIAPPLCIILLIVAKKLNFLTLTLIYGLILIMGLCYTTRSSTAYLYASEILPEKYRLHFGSTIFMIDGFTTICTATFFGTLGSQDLYLMWSASISILALFAFYLWAPESPPYLL